MNNDDAATPGGIPQAEFIEDVAAHLAKSSITHDEAITQLQDLYSKYKFIDVRLVTSKNNLKGKIPEIKKTLEAVQFLRQKASTDEVVTTHFELAANVLATANVSKVEHVCLWLGANVMMEFTFDEAETLLSKNLKTAGENLAVVEGQLAFLRDQITTSEVNIARVYNHEVRLRQAAKAS
mmetsp:Transcript_24661/g.57011  ORF Transcript_24661/g.57011 Transcript_24661/m.57011 type:complete len:180 (-) Transcript_24661:36-575(-)